MVVHACNSGLGRQRQADFWGLQARRPGQLQVPMRFKKKKKMWKVPKEWHGKLTSRLHMYTHTSIHISTHMKYDKE